MSNEPQIEPHRPKRSSASMQVLHFTVQDFRFCVELETIQRLVPLVELQPFPGGSRRFKGLLNLGGESIPVVDLKERVGLTSGDRYPLNTLIVLCGDERRRAGFIVQQVLGVSSVEKHELKQERLFHEMALPFRGVVNQGGVQSLLFDLERVLDSSCAMPVPEKVPWATRRT